MTLALAAILLLAALVYERVRSPADNPEAQVLPAAAPSAPSPAAVVGTPAADAEKAPLASPEVAAGPASPPAASSSEARISEEPTPKTARTLPPATAAGRASTKPSQVRAGLRPAPAPAPAKKGALPAPPTRNPASYATNPGF